jgi:hypothetical protein
LAEEGQPGRGAVQVSMMQAQKTEVQKTDLLVLPKEEEGEEAQLHWQVPRVEWKKGKLEAEKKPEVE